MEPELETQPELAHRPGLLIVSEARLFGEGLADALARDETVLVLGHCSSPAAAAAAARLRPAIVLLDAAVAGGHELVAALMEAAPVLRVIVIALAETQGNVIGWAEAGVAGYIPNTTALRDVVPTVIGILQGKQDCSRTVAAGLFRRVRAVTAEPEPACALTAREMQVVGLIGAGLSNKQIARRLNIGVATTKSHVHNLLGKLNVQRRSQAVIQLRGSSHSSI